MSYYSRLVNHSLSLLSLSCLLASTPTNAEALDQEKPSPTIYAAIAESYLRSFPPLEQKAQKKKPEISIFNPIPDVEIPNELGETEKRTIAFQILEKNETAYTKNDILSEGLWDNLELFLGSHKKDTHLFGKINHTKTITGEIALARMIVEPTANIETLKQRQAIVKALVTDDALLAKLEGELETFKQGEASFLAYWKEASEMFELQTTSQYSSLWDGLNKSPTYLEMTTRATQGYFATTSTILLAMIPVFYRLRAQNPHDAQNTLFAAYLTIVGPLYATLMFSVEKTNHKLRTLFQKSLIDLALCTSAMESTSSTIRANESLRANLKNVLPIWSFINQPENMSTDLKQLLELLKTNTFKGSPSFFSSVGRILTSQKLMHEVKDLFVNAYKAFGEIDAYVSIAKLYKKHVGQNATYCFPVYKEESDTPAIELKECWNPMIDSTKVITNSLTLGDQKEKNKNIILSGPNAGGKSTVLKALIINIMLAQSLGIAPSKSFVLTPFRKINTYLNITDDLAAGNSLFKAEVLRAQQLVHTVRNLKKGEFCFTVMDEVFSGTSPIEGEAAAYSIAKYLAKQRQGMSIIATHFPRLTELEEVTLGNYVNKRVAVVKNDDGSLTYPYKLEDGKTSQNIALDILRLEGFESEMLDDAYNIVAQHAKNAAATAA